MPTQRHKNKMESELSLAATGATPALPKGTSLSPMDLGFPTGQLLLIESVLKSESNSVLRVRD